MPGLSRSRPMGGYMFDFSSIHSLADITREQRRLRPAATAQIFEDRRTSFAELDEAASRIANALLSLNLPPGARLAYLGKNSDRYFELLFGAFKAGNVVVSVNWRLALPELVYIFNDAQCEALFVGAEYHSLVPELLAACPRLRSVVAMDGEGAPWPAFTHWRDAAPSEDCHLPVNPDAEVMLLYTSGTTGSPKGVQITTANYLAFFRAAELAEWGDIQTGEVNLACMPVFHVAGVNMGIISIAQGASVVVMKEVDPAKILDFIPLYGINNAFFVPAVILFMLQHPRAATTDFRSLRRLYYGASPIAEDLLLKAREIIGCQFFQLYGLTETVGAATYLPDAAHAPERGKLRSCGVPYPGIDIRVVDEAGNALPPAAVGEVVIRSGVVMKGYWGAPAATAEAIVDGWFHTGDAGYFDTDGYLYIHDRMKDMIVSGGENIYPAEVENALFGHPAVADVAVIGVPDPRWGEAVKAIVVLKPGAQLSPEDLIAYARTRIAAYKTPKSVDFIAALPRNPSGKVLRRELREPYWHGQSRRVN